MGKVSEVDIKGHKYRYEYDEESGKTLYRGPVGTAPTISEAEFQSAMGSRSEIIRKIGERFPRDSKEDFLLDDLERYLIEERIITPDPIKVQAQVSRYRNLVARGEGISDRKVFNDAMMKSIGQEAPLTVEELADIKGISKQRAEDNELVLNWIKNTTGNSDFKQLVRDLYDDGWIHIDRTGPIPTGRSTGHPTVYHDIVGWSSNMWVWRR